MRKFLVYINEKKRDGINGRDGVTILGIVESEMYPSSLQNEEVEVDGKIYYKHIAEVKEKCFVRI